MVSGNTAPEQTQDNTGGKLLYSGPAGKIWTNGLDLYHLRARSVGVMGVMAGTPSHQPSQQEVEAVSRAARTAYGKLGPWPLTIGAVLVFLALRMLGVPAWVTVLVGLLMTLALVGLPIYRQFRAFEGLFRTRDELTILLSENPTQSVSSVVEIGPETPAQQLGAAQQPVAVVVRGLPVAERVKLAGAVTRHVALFQRQKRPG